MPRITKRLVDASEIRDRDYFTGTTISQVSASCASSPQASAATFIEYRALGRSRRYTIGLHGIWTPETARHEAKVQFGRVAQDESPAEERQLDHKSITVKELCTLRRIAPTAPDDGTSWPGDWPRPARLLAHPEPIETMALLPDHRRSVQLARHPAPRRAGRRPGTRIRRMVAARCRTDRGARLFGGRL
jgi:hypothetical protein